MGQSKYPRLTPDEVMANLTKLGFSWKRTTGDHAQYERLPSMKDPKRRVVTVDTGTTDFGEALMKSMIGQSGDSREEFYGATKRTARKAGVVFTRLSIEGEK